MRLSDLIRVAFSHFLARERYLSPYIALMSSLQTQGAVSPDAHLVGKVMSREHREVVC